MNRSSHVPCLLLVVACVLCLGCDESTSGIEKTPPGASGGAGSAPSPSSTSSVPSNCELSPEEACDLAEPDTALECNADGTVSEVSCTESFGFGTGCDPATGACTTLMEPPCLRACFGLAVCGWCVAVEGQCLTISDCHAFCEAPPASIEAAECLNVLYTCDKAAVDACLALI